MTISDWAVRADEFQAQLEAGELGTVDQVLRSVGGAEDGGLLFEFASSPGAVFDDLTDAGWQIDWTSPDGRRHVFVLPDCGESVTLIDSSLYLGDRSR